MIRSEFKAPLYPRSFEKLEINENLIDLQDGFSNIKLLQDIF